MDAHILPDQYAKRFLGERGRLATVQEEVVEVGDLTETIRVTLRSSRGLTVQSLLRLPRDRSRPAPVAIIPGGLFTGAETIRLVGDVPGLERVGLFSMDYPFDGPKTNAGWSLLMAAWRIRRSIFRTVAALLLMVEYLTRRNDADTARIVVIGISWGGIFGIIAATLEARIACLVVIYCGGDLGAMVAANVVPGYESLARLLGRMAAWILAPGEPLRYIGAVAPRPVLFINGMLDERIPRACSDKLFEAAGEPKEQVWLQSQHPGSKRSPLTQQLTEVVSDWLSRRGIL